MKIEMGKQYRTRDGREVRLLAVDMPGPYPVVVAECDSDGGGYLLRVLTSHGHVREGFRELGDLIEVKPERVAWINIYEGGVASHCLDSKEVADLYAGSTRIACVKITFRDGDGL